MSRDVLSRTKEGDARAKLRRFWPFSEGSTDCRKSPRIIGKNARRPKNPAPPGLLTCGTQVVAINDGRAVRPHIYSVSSDQPAPSKRQTSPPPSLDLDASHAVYLKRP